MVYLGLFFVLGSIILVGLLRYFPAPTSAFMLHRHIEDYQKNRAFLAINQSWVERQQISNHAFSAVIAAEDQRFFIHSGFDTDAILLALDSYLAGGKLRGASTISQQVAKNLFLSPARAFWRKGLEIWFTVLIEALWDKRRILEMYLNIAEFGDHLFGIEAASRHYFGIPARRLSIKQAALLAATLPNPLAYKADNPSDYVLTKQQWILIQMKNLNYPI